MRKPPVRIRTMPVYFQEYVDPPDVRLFRHCPADNLRAVSDSLRVAMNLDPTNRQIVDDWSTVDVLRTMQRHGIRVYTHYHGGKHYFAVSGPGLV